VQFAAPSENHFQTYCI